MLRVRLPHELTPDDGHRLLREVTVTNGVEGQTPLSRNVGWMRWVCRNGMSGWTKGGRWKHVTGAGGGDRLVGRLDRQIRIATDGIKPEAERFRRMLGHAISPTRLFDFCDVILRKKWGFSAACRAWHICTSGLDGAVKEPTGRQREAAREVRVNDVEPREAGRVPGAYAPTANAYGVGQALSWIASHDESFARRQKRVAQVADLLRRLVR